MLCDLRRRKITEEPRMVKPQYNCVKVAETAPYENYYTHHIKSVVKLIKQTISKQEVYGIYSKSSRY